MPPHNAPLGRSVNSPGSTPASFISPKRLQPGLTLVSGPRGAGKTLWCLELARQARALGLEPRGLASPAVIENGFKTGIDLLDLASGERRRLAVRRNATETGYPATPDWRMSAETLRWGNAILENLKSCDLFILDELGPLEFQGGLGLTAGLGFVDSHRDLPLFVVIRPSLLEAACQRWPWALIFDLAAQPQ